MVLKQENNGSSLHATSRMKPSAVSRELLGAHLARYMHVNTCSTALAVLSILLLLLLDATMHCCRAAPGSLLRLAVNG